MATWHRIPPETIRQERLQVVGGVTFKVSASPYDVPEAFRHFYDSKIGRHVIEFRYLTDEKERRQPVDEVITFVLGKNTNRLLRIEIDVRKLAEKTLRAVLPQLNRMLERYTTTYNDRAANYQAAEQFLRANENMAIFS